MTNKIPLIVLVTFQHFAIRELIYAILVVGNINTKLDAKTIKYPSNKWTKQFAWLTIFVFATTQSLSRLRPGSVVQCWLFQFEIVASWQIDCSDTIRADSSRIRLERQGKRKSSDQTGRLREDFSKSRAI